MEKQDYIILGCLIIVVGWILFYVSLFIISLYKITRVVDEHTTSDKLEKESSPYKIPDCTVNIVNVLV